MILKIINGGVFLQTQDLASIPTKLIKEKNTLEYASVKYVIVPDDTEKEIFLKNGTYSEKVYAKTVQEVKKVPYLKQLRGFGKIAVFQVQNPKTLFWSPKEGMVKSYKTINPTLYEITLQHVKKGDVVIFSDTYDPYWIASIVSTSYGGITSTKYDGLFNSFVLKKDGSYTLRVYYSVQKYVDIALVISLVTCIMVCIRILV